MPRQQIVRKLEKLEEVFDTLILSLNRILELSERINTGVAIASDKEIGEEYTRDLLQQIIITKDEIDNMKDFTSQTAEYQGNFLNFLEYEENYLFSSDVLKLIDLQYQKPNQNYLLDYLKKEIEQVRRVQLQFVSRILCLLTFRDTISKAMRGQLLHIRVILRSYMELGVLLDMFPLHTFLSFCKSSPRRLLSIMQTLPMHQYEKLRTRDYQQVSIATFSDAPLFLLCMYVVILVRYTDEQGRQSGQPVFFKLFEQLTLTPRHIYLGGTDMFLPQFKPDGLSIVVRPMDVADTDIDTGAGTDTGANASKIREYKEWEDGRYSLSVRYEVINFSVHLLHLGMSVYREMDPQETNFCNLLAWFYSDSPSQQVPPPRAEFCLPIGYITGSIDTIPVEIRKLKDVLAKIDTAFASPSPLTPRLVERICNAYEVATGEACDVAGRSSKVDGLTLNLDAHTFSIVFLLTIRTRVYEKEASGILVFFAMQPIS